MIPVFVYLIKVNLAFILLYLLYKVTFGKDTFLRMHRLILIGIYVIAFTYPLVNLPADAFVDFRSGLSVNLPEWVVYAGGAQGANVAIPEMAGQYQPATTSITPIWLLFLLGVYSVGVLALFSRTALELVKTFNSFRNYTAMYIKGVKVYVSEDIKEPYSFFKGICLPIKITGNEDVAQILVHEKAHADQWHSADILLAQLAIIFCWFNPFVWLMRSEIRMNHEYLADKEVVSSGYNKKNYQYHLIGFKQPPHPAAADLYNNFSVLPLKNRIKMMNKKKTPDMMRSKFLIFIPMVLLLLFLSNCKNDKQSQSATAESQTETLQEKPALPADVDASSKEGKYASDTAQIVVAAGQKKQEKAASAPPPPPILKDAKNDVYDVAEVMPEFPGGVNALMKYLSEHVKYPVDAQEKGISGTVILGFVVAKDGSINNVSIMKSVSESIDKEAVRVVKGMPKWTPGMQGGKQVDVKYTLPVKFKLQA